MREALGVPFLGGQVAPRLLADFLRPPGPRITLAPSGPVELVLRRGG
jgi:hypothetical protein